MALPSTLIKFRLFNADGSAAVGLHVSARITRPDTDDGAVVPSISVSADSDAAGECTLALWPNARGTTGSQYSVTISRGSQTVDNYTITVPESGSMVLVESIKSAPPYPSVSAAQQALEAAQAATVVAQGHATTATTQAGIAASAAADAAQSAADAVSVIPVGGTTGQVLAKASDADLDTEWVPQTGGGGGGATNLAYTASPTGGTVTSDTGTDATIPLADGTNAGLMAPAEKTKLAAQSGTNTGDQDLSNYSTTTHNHAGVYDPAGTAAAAVGAHEGAADPHPGYVLESAIGVAGGVTPLDGTGKVASAYLPAYVDDVLEYANAGALPGTGVAGVIYVTLDDNKTWRWGGSSYTEISPSPGTTDAVPEGSTNLYHTAARVLGQVLTGLSTAAGTVVTSAHTILQAIGFLQKQVSDNATAISGKQSTLVSGTNIKTINSNSLLGSGDLTVSASPGGSTTQVQFNDAGAFGGDSGLTFNKTTKKLTVGGNIDLSGGNGTISNTGIGVLSIKASSAAYEFGWNKTLQLGGSGGVTTAYTITIGMAFSDITAYALNIVGGDAWGASTNKDGGVVNIAGGAPSGTGSKGAVNASRLNAAGFATAIAAKTANYTATADDSTIQVDATSGAITITLPAVSGAAGRIYVIKKIDASGNAVTVDPNASETIDGATTVSLASQYSTITIQANAAGTAWHKISGV